MDSQDMDEDTSFVSELTEKEVVELHKLLPGFKQEVVTRLEMLESVENLDPLNQFRVIGWLVDFGGDLDDNLAITKGIELGESIDKSHVFTGQIQQPAQRDPVRSSRGLGQPV